MKVIHKYTLDKGSITTLRLPGSADLIKVDRQYNDICIWFIVDTDNISESRDFIIYGTGEELTKDPSELYYLDTVKFDDGSMILHVFEII